MDVAISGASGLIGTALSTSLRADGHRVLRLARGGVTGDDAIGWDPEAGRIDAPGARRASTRSCTSRARASASSRWTRRAEAPHPREPRARHRGARGRGREPRAQAAACSCRARRSGTTATAATRCSPRRARPATTSSPRCASRGKPRRSRRPRRACAPCSRAPASCSTRTAARSQQMLLPFKLGLGGRQGSGKQWMSWIALADEVGAIRHAIDDDAVRGPVNLVAPNPVTNAEFAAHARSRRCTGRRSCRRRCSR